MKLTTFLSIVIAETILTIVCILAIGFIAGCIREERREDGEWPQIRRVPSGGQESYVSLKTESRPRQSNENT